MANTISAEAKLATSLLTDVDKYRLKYKTREVDSETDTNLVIKFVSPSLMVYDNFKFFLLKNSTYEDLSPKDFYRPDYVAYRKYGTTTLWTMILYINDIPNIEAFEVDKIYLPTIDAIYRLIDANNTGGVVSLSNINTLSRSNSVSATIYTKTPEPSEQNQTAVAPVDQKSFYFIRQTFNVTLEIAARQYIDLSYEATEQSLTFKIKDRTSVVYGKDYKLVKDTAGRLKRLTWNSRYVDGDGLLEVIEEGMILEVQYARELP